MCIRSTIVQGGAQAELDTNSFKSPADRGQLGLLSSKHRGLARQLPRGQQRHEGG